MNATLITIDWSTVNPTTRRYPRTQIEAFPQDGAECIESPPVHSLGDKAVGFTLGLAAVFLVVLFSLGG